MNNAIEFVAIFRELEKVYNSNATWETKYGACFVWGKIYERMINTGIGVNYNDPDTSCEEDVTAFYLAAKRVFVEIKKLLQEDEPGK